jgi:hypothetical protein
MDKKKARLVTDVHLRCEGEIIETNPKGTEFVILTEGQAYSTCEGLSVTSVWPDEYELTS